MVTALIFSACGVDTEAAGPIVGNRNTGVAALLSEQHDPLAPTQIVESADPGDAGLVGFEVVIPLGTAAGASERTDLTSASQLSFPSPSGAPEANSQEERSGPEVHSDTSTVESDAIVDGGSEVDSDPEVDSNPAASGDTPLVSTDEPTQPDAAEATVANAQPAPAQTVASTEPAQNADEPPAQATDSLVVRGTGRTEGPADRAAPGDEPMSEPAALACSTVELATADLDRGDSAQFGAEMAVAAGFATSAPEPQLAAAADELLAAATAEDPLEPISDFLTTCVSLGYQL